MAQMLGGLLGNETHRARLSHALRTDTLSHAFLLLGPEGVGRHTLALELAAAANCERRGTDEALPCHGCSSCRRILAGQHPDLHILRRAEDKSTVGVDEVRALREDMFLSPTEASVKVYLIEHAEALTVQAQNALLKVLEEPPHRVLLFLLADTADSLLTTVRSRTVCIRMERLTDAQLLPALRRMAREAQLTPDEATVARAVRRSEGVLGVAFSLIHPATAEAEERMRLSVSAVLRTLSAKASYTAAHTALSALGQKRAELSGALCRLTDAVRDLLAVKRDEGAPLIFFLDEEEAKALADGFTVKVLCGMQDAIARAQDKLLRNANVTLLLSELAQDINKKT